MASRRRECAFVSRIKKWYKEAKEKLRDARVKTFLRVKEVKNKLKMKCLSVLPAIQKTIGPAQSTSLAATVARGGVNNADIRQYVLRLATDKESVFAESLNKFIDSTKHSEESDPQKVMRQMRHFMTAMKRSLSSQPAPEFAEKVKRERDNRLTSENVNLDSILEDVMHQLVTVPLKDHLCRLFAKEYDKNGSIQTMVDHIMYARKRPPSELGVTDTFLLPSRRNLKKVAEIFRLLQIADSPIDKLKSLLSVVAAIYQSIEEENSQLKNPLIGADDFLPIFVWVIVQIGMVAAEVEAEYMWGLLPPCLLSGEGGYYLTTLSSAVNIVKNFRPTCLAGQEAYYMTSLSGDSVNVGNNFKQSGLCDFLTTIPTSISIPTRCDKCDTWSSKCSKLIRSLIPARYLLS